MKPEIKDIAVQAAVSSPTTAYALITDLGLAQWIALILGILQGIYLARKWWREESEWGLQMRRLAGQSKSPVSKDCEADQ